MTSYQSEKIIKTFLVWQFRQISIHPEANLPRPYLTIFNKDLRDNVKHLIKV